MNSVSFLYAHSPRPEKIAQALATRTIVANERAPSHARSDIIMSPIAAPTIYIASYVRRLAPVMRYMHAPRVAATYIAAVRAGTRTPPSIIAVYSTCARAGYMHRQRRAWATVQ